MKVYNKNFDEWNVLKKELHKRKNIPFFHEREIWWCALGLNVGFEEDGKNDNFERPILIMRVFSHEVLWVLPMTSQDRTGEYYHQFRYRGEKYSIIISQLKLISSRRLLRKIRKFSERDFLEVKNKIKNLL